MITPRDAARTVPLRAPPNQALDLSCRARDTAGVRFRNAGHGVIRLGSRGLPYYRRVGSNGRSAAGLSPVVMNSASRRPVAGPRVMPHMP
jgi:hypothetical protein